ncbi:MAG: hypothetical protein AB7K24_10075 [Gemmataceae bacterium]
MIKQLGTLIVVVMGAWFLVAIPARHLMGDWALVYSGVAALTCLVPACLTLAGSSWLLQQPDQLVLAVLGSTGVRMFLVLGVVWFLTVSVPYFREHDGLWAWFLGFYLLTLATEIALLLSRPGQDHK